VHRHMSTIHIAVEVDFDDADHVTTQSRINQQQA